MAVEFDRNRSTLGWQRRPSRGVFAKEEGERRDSTVRDVVTTAVTLTKFAGYVARVGATVAREKLREKAEPLFPNGTRKERLEAWGLIEAIHAEHDLGQLVHQGAFEYTVDADGRQVSKHAPEAQARHYLSVIMGTLPDEPAGTPDELLILDQFGTGEVVSSVRFFRVNGDPDIHGWSNDDVDYHVGQTFVRPQEIQTMAAVLESQF